MICMFLLQSYREEDSIEFEDMIDVQLYPPRNDDQHCVVHINRRSGAPKVCVLSGRLFVCLVCLFSVYFCNQLLVLLGTYHSNLVSQGVQPHAMQH